MQLDSNGEASQRLPRRREEPQRYSYAAAGESARTGTGLVQTRKADVQDPVANPKGGGGLLLRVSWFLRMDAIWLITGSLAVGAVVKRVPLRRPKAGLYGVGCQSCCPAESAKNVAGVFMVWVKRVGGCGGGEKGAHLGRVLSVGTPERRSGGKNASRSMLGKKETHAWWPERLRQIQRYLLRLICSLREIDAATVNAVSQQHKTVFSDFADQAAA